MTLGLKIRCGLAALVTLGVFLVWRDSQTTVREVWLCAIIAIIVVTTTSADVLASQQPSDAEKGKS